MLLLLNKSTMWSLNLANPPRLTHDLLLLLDQAEKLLYQVCQSPEISMLHALKPSLKALIQDNLLRHSDVDVKVAVASCISEITRITAPVAAYDNDQMRNAFQLIVSSFEDLADQSSRSYIRRASILETVSKVRSCVIMLNLKCDGMIVDMFEHFLSSVRDYHRGVIYSSMENIMILVLEESREISVEMLKPILATVKKHNEGVLPIARKLGEDVLTKSAEKLKPYLMPALIALGDSLDTYTEIVTRVCEGTTVATKCDDENASSQLREVTHPATNLTVEDSSTNLTVVSIKETNVNSEIWANFDLCVMSDGSIKARCKKCGDFFEHGGNTTLKNHMNKSCPALKAASASSQTTMGVSGVTYELPVSATRMGVSGVTYLPSSATTKGVSGVTCDLPVSTTTMGVSGVTYDLPVSATTMGVPGVTCDLPVSTTTMGVPGVTCDLPVSATTMGVSGVTCDLPVSTTTMGVSGVTYDLPVSATTMGVSGVTCDLPVSATTMGVSGVTCDLPVFTTTMGVSRVTCDLPVSATTMGFSGVTYELPVSATRMGVSGVTYLPVSATTKGVSGVTCDLPVSTTTMGVSGVTCDLPVSATTMGVSGVTCDLPVSATTPPSIPLPSSTANDSTSHFMSVMLNPLKGILESMDKKLDHMRSKLDVIGTKVDHLDKSVTSLHEKYDSTIAKMTTQVKKLSKEVFNFRSGCKSDTRKNKRTHDLPEGDNHEGEKRAKRARSENIVSGQAKRSSKENTSQEGIREDEAKTLSSDDEMDVSPKSAKKPAKGDDKDKESETIKYDESLVGKKIKVWWPEDQMYYEGVIKSYDAAKKKHKVSYVDGDEENLYLRNQRWAIIQNFSARDKESDTIKYDESLVKRPATVDSSIDSDLKPKKQARKKAVVTKEVKHPATIDSSCTSSKRKRIPVKEFETIKYDESLVGKKVKVWWPKDKMYYEGVIESFDAANKKHKVLHVDGEEENLYLRKERWSIIQNFSAQAKEMGVSPKPAKKPAKGEDNLKDMPGTASQRKRTKLKNNESDAIKYDESLVGKKVKVWCSEDKMYYEGVIESFDAAKKEHKVLYLDGEEENIYLRNERWMFLQNFPAQAKCGNMDVVDKQQENVELEHQLIEVGNKLSNPPRSSHDLLLLLDQAEKLLYQVCQSPKISMLHALKPSMKALIQDDLLRNSDVDVKVAVASCISQITRITAPDEPYDDDQMRDVFQLIVSSFEDLADQSSRSYNRRVSILKTVARVGSCVIMLDLECDGMIVEMFKHFLRSVREYHRGVIYSSMEKIMILVLEESEDNSVEMLKPLLATVKKHNEGVLPIARKLGEEVLKKSAEKLKPYLISALTALGDSLDSYTEIVTRVCEGTTAAMKRDDEKDSGQQPEVKRPATIDLSSDSELKAQKQAGKEAVVTKEVKCPASVDSDVKQAKCFLHACVRQ